MARARLPQLHSITDGSFEPNRKNPILLGDDDVLDTHQKTIKIGGQNTPLSLNKDELRINGDLFLNGKLTSHLIECDSDYLTFRPNVYTRFESTDLSGTLDLYISGGDSYFLTSGDDFYFIGSTTGLFNFGATGTGVTLFQMDSANSKFIIKDNTDTGDNFTVQVSEHAVTNITTTDDDATAGHLSLTPDGDLILDPVSQKTIINATDGLYFDSGNDTYIKEGAADRLDFYVGGVLLLQISEAVVDSVHVNCNLSIDAASKLWFDGSITGNTYITESSADILDIYVGAKNLLKLDKTNDRITLSSSKLVAAMADGTEYSATDSAYAGMILGYTDIGLDEVHTNLSLTTSYVVPTDEFSVSFVAPPSGNVLIEFHIQHGAGSSGVGQLHTGLSTANATSGYAQLEDFHEKIFADLAGRGDVIVVNGSYTLTGLTAGTSYERWIGFKTASTTGTPFIQWGGNSAGRYPDFIMKAIALPASITT